MTAEDNRIHHRILSKHHRRRFLASVLALVGAGLLPVSPAAAHTPYGQWKNFRERHLQILTARSDLAGDAVADTWVAALVEHLPKSKAVVSRARNLIRVASLLKTDQAKLAVLSYEQADAMFSAASPFESFSPMPLQLLVDNGSYLLVARDDLPLQHGFLLATTLLEQAESLHVGVPLSGMFGMAVHPGALSAALEKGLTPRLE